MTNEHQPLDLNNTAGLKAALNLLAHWGCTAEQEQAILGMAKATLYKARSFPESIRLSQDQVERISYLLNIHESLWTVFSNPANVYGFMSMPNHNPYFNGRTPLELISGGSHGVLYEVYRRIDSLQEVGQ